MAVDIEHPVEFWTSRLAHPEATNFKLCLREDEMARERGH